MGPYIPLVDDAAGEDSEPTFVRDSIRQKEEPTQKFTKSKANPYFVNLLRWWLLFCTFLLFSWIDIRNGSKTEIYCMDEVLNMAVSLNETSADSEKWNASGLSRKLEHCSTHMAEYMIPNCDSRYWTYFNRSMSALRFIEYALMRVPEADTVLQWLYMDNCSNSDNITKLTSHQECEETTAYTHCLEKFTNFTRATSVVDELFEQAHSQGDVLHTGVPLLKQIVSRVKLNMSRVFQNVTCECIVSGGLKKIAKFGLSAFPFADVGWCALLAFVLVCIYLLIKTFLDGSLKSRAIKLYDILVDYIMYSNSGPSSFRRRGSFSKGTEPITNEPIPMEPLSLP